MPDINPVCTLRCMGCGKEAVGQFYEHSQAWHKPRDWYQRSDKNGVELACSRKCIDAISSKSGSSPLVLPI